MHLVFISSLVPVEAPTIGFSIANRVVLDALLALGHRVSVIGYLAPGETPVSGVSMSVLGTFEVSNARVGLGQKLVWLARAIAAGTTLSSAKMLNVSEKRIARILDGLGPIDGLVLNSVQLPAAFIELFSSYPSIYVAHNVEADSARENARTATGLLEKYLYKREARLLDVIEQRLARQATWIWTFAEADRFGFGACGAAHASCLPLVTSWSPPSPPVMTQRGPDLALIGTWSWKPNRIGLDWFVEQVVPHLPSGMTIDIAGQITGEMTSPHPGLRFVGRVPDARAFVTAAAVVPLISRGGTGVQLKTIEALELGMRCVATRSSVRGIAALPDTCRVADDAREFAETLVHSVALSRSVPADRTAGLAFHRSQTASLLAAMQPGLSQLGDIRAAQASKGRQKTMQELAGLLAAMRPGQPSPDEVRPGDVPAGRQNAALPLPVTAQTKRRTAREKGVAR